MKSQNSIFETYVYRFVIWEVGRSNPLITGVFEKYECSNIGSNQGSRLPMGQEEHQTKCLYWENGVIGSLLRNTSRKGELRKIEVSSLSLKDFETKPVSNLHFRPFDDFLYPGTNIGSTQDDQNILRNFNRFCWFFFYQGEVLSMFLIKGSSVELGCRSSFEES